MAKTLLQSVNAVLKRVKVIAGQQDEFGGLVSQGRQHDIDLAVQIINEGIQELFSLSDRGMPNEVTTSTITLVQGQRSYSLASDLIQIRYPLIDQTNGEYIYQHPDGYFGIQIIDPEQDDTGLPIFAAIDPTNGNLYLDRSPTSEDAGKVYTYWYDKALALSDKDDTVPFNDTVFREMVPVWAQLWSVERHGEFQTGIYRRHLANAARYLIHKQQRHTWLPR